MGQLAGDIPDATIYAAIDKLMPGLDPVVRQKVCNDCDGYFRSHGTRPKNWDGTSAPNVIQLASLYAS